MLSYIATLKTTGTQPDVVTLSDLKDHLNITHTYQDTLIQAYLEAAITQAENYTARSLKIYEVTANTNVFTQNIQLEKTPYKSTIVIKYQDISSIVNKIL